MDKVKYVFRLPDEIEIEHNGVKIKIVPFLKASQQIYLINQYIEQYFEELSEKDKVVSLSKYNYMTAEYNMRGYIYQMLTNIDHESITQETLGDDILWDKIEITIVNFYDFYYKNLDYIIEDIKFQIQIENSVGNVIANFSDKISNILDKFSEMTPEEIEKLQIQGKELLEELKENAIIKDMTRKK